MLEDLAEPTIPETSAPAQAIGAAAWLPAARPRGYPLLGVLPSLLRDGPALVRNLTWQYPGQAIQLPLGPSRAMFFTQPDQIQYILADNWRNFTKQGGVWKPLQRLLGDGLLTANGDTWFANRRLIQPLFSTKHLASLVELMVEVIEKDMVDLMTYVDRGPVEIHRLAMKWAQRVILATFFGTSIRPEQSEALGQAILDAFAGVNSRLFLYFIPDRLLPGERAFQAALTTLDQTMYSMIAARREQGGEHSDLLALLLAARDEAGEGMSDRQLRDELVTMFIGAIDTTSLTMTWMLYLLDQHPEVHARLDAEMDEVIGDRRPRSEDLAKLVYGKRVIQETLRMYPPSWFIPRTVMQDDEVCGHPVSAGETVIVSQYAVQHDPLFWDSPMAFDPDRFLPERSEGRPRYAYMPFGGGARQCIGNMLAINELLVTLALMRKRVRARLVPGHPVAPKSATTLRPSQGMMMTLHAP